MEPLRDSARTQIIHINSQNRISGTPGDFTLSFANELFKLQSDKGYIRVDPIQAVIYRSWYTVDTSCNFFQVFDGTNTVDYVIPIGFYNVKSFLAILSLTLLPTWLIGWEPITSRYFYQPPNDGNVYQFLFPSMACHLMGFIMGTQPTLSYATPIYSDFPVKMTIESVVLVHVNFPKKKYAAVDNLLTSSMAESDIFIKIPVTCPPFENLVWRANSTDIVSFDLSTRTIDNLRVYLTDEFGRQLSPNYDWTMSFRVSYYEDSNPEGDVIRDLGKMNDYLKYMALEQVAKSQRKENKKKAKHKTQAEEPTGDGLVL